MASEGSTYAIIKRREDELALMPPPPSKKAKRPIEVLDEDEYAEALSDVIARDYYPGLREAKAQEEYLDALNSQNPTWIREAERKLRQATTGDSEVKKVTRQTRDSRFDTPRSYRQAADTPRGPTGAATPAKPVEDDKVSDAVEHEKRQVDTSKLSLSEYQAKYTSEDNHSFNALLDRQNDKRRKTHAYMWTKDQRIPSQRLIAHRAQQHALRKEHADDESTNGKDLVPLTTGATADRSATPSSWRTTSPANNFVFIPQSSIDEQGLTTLQDQKEAMSKAGPKRIIHENTRFPPSGPRWEADDNDDATSIHTSFVARRNAGAGGADVGTVTGAETPRVNGYAFVDEDEEPPATLPPQIKSEPTYRDLLAGQAGDGTPNPFRLREKTAREALHHKLVERDAEKKRSKMKDVTAVKDGKDMGNMTPAARRMMERLGGRTPQVSAKAESRREDWTPVATPRRSRAVK